MSDNVKGLSFNDYSECDEHGEDSASDLIMPIDLLVHADIKEERRFC